MINKYKEDCLPRLPFGMGLSPRKRSSTFFVTSFPYIDPNEEITSSSGSFRRGSSDSGRSDKSASRDGGDVDFSMSDWGSEEATAFPFPFSSLRDSQLFLSHPEGGGKFGTFRKVVWEVSVPRAVLGLLEQPSLAKE